MWGCGVHLKQIPRLPPRLEGNTTKRAADGAAAQRWGQGPAGLGPGRGRGSASREQKGAPTRRRGPGPKGQLGGHGALEAQDGGGGADPGFRLTVHRARAGNLSEV